MQGQDDNQHLKAIRHKLATVIMENFALNIGGIIGGFVGGACGLVLLFLFSDYLRDRRMYGLMKVSLVAFVVAVAVGGNIAWRLLAVKVRQFKEDLSSSDPPRRDG